MRAKGAIENVSRLFIAVIGANHADWGAVCVWCEKDEPGVSGQGVPAADVFFEGLFGLSRVLVNGAVVAASQEVPEILLGGSNLCLGGGAEAYDTLEVIEDWLGDASCSESGYDGVGLEMLGDVLPAYKADCGGDIAFVVKDSCGDLSRCFLHETVARSGRWGAVAEVGNVDMSMGAE